MTIYFSKYDQCIDIFILPIVLQMSEEACGLCGRPFNEDFVIPINGSEDQQHELTAKLTLRKTLDKRKRASVSAPDKLTQQKLESSKHALLEL